MKPTSELSDTELREAVAVEVMGKKVRAIANDDSKHAGEYAYCYDGGTYCRDYLGDGALVEDRASGSWEIPYYESSIEAAFEVVEKMREDEFREFDLGTHGRHWGATFKGVIGEVWRKFAGYGESPARAICIAALTAVRARKA